MRKLTALIALLLAVIITDAQDATNVRGGKRGATLKLHKVGWIPGIPAEDPWKVQISPKAIYHSGLDSVKAMKAEKTQLKKTAELGVGNEKFGRSVQPVASTSIAGTTMSSWTPPDNAVAVSNGGRIVAADNEDISYFTTSGSTLGSTTHTSFFSAQQSGNANLFDPKLIYDSQEDRFIYVLLHGNSFNTSKILVCFSSSNNPYQDGWEIYELDGNPLNNSKWSDYPNIGVNDNELFITVNLFSNTGSFDQVVIFQIDKHAGYAGNSVDYTIWDNVVNTGGFGVFTVVPASFGQQGTYGPNMYFVSSRSNNGNRLYLHEITGDLNDANAELVVSSVSVPNYEVGGYVPQPSGNDLDPGDTRIKDAFYLNGVVHTVHGVDYSSGYNGFAYYRIPVDAPNTTENDRFGISGKDYCYPSLASYGLNECEKSVMISFLNSGTGTYPEMRVVNCDQNMDWSGSTQLQSGSSSISYLSGIERWGDYSSMARKHNATSPEVWAAGCYGTSSSRYRTGIVKVIGDYEAVEGPLVSFESNDSTIQKGGFVTFQDLSTGGNSRVWTFEGGGPPTSTSSNPSVTYVDTGKFDVTLQVFGDGCNQTVTIEDMIHVTKIDTDTVVLAGGFTVFIVDGDTFQLWNGILVPLGKEEVAVKETKVYPNPIIPTEMFYVELTLPDGAMINARVFDMSGAEVKKLYYDRVKPGIHQLGFNKLALPAGQYILLIESESETIVNEKIIVAD